MTKTVVPESEVQKKVRDYAKSLGWLTYKWRSVNQRGVPDCIFVSPKGQTLFVEFKRKGGKPTALQERVIKDLKANKALVFVIDDIDYGIGVISYLTYS